MVLNERQDGQKWFSREKRERLDLSVSVEETLEEPMMDEITWSEELDEQFSLSQPSRGKGVFPPRLSLQSRPVPALHADNSVKSYLSSYVAVPAEQERKATTETQNQKQNTNMLKRFTQRLTSSFAALGGGQHEVVESVVQYPQEEEVRRTKLPASPLVEESIHQASELPGEPQIRERIVPQRPVSSVDDEFHNRQSKQRLAGRTTRIHLETPSVAARSYQAGISNIDRSRSNLVSESGLSTMNGPDLYRETTGFADGSLPRTTRSFESVSSTISSQPEMIQEPKIVDSTSTLLPALNIINEKASDRVMLSGSGVFESGRSEAIVVNRHVTDASVVLVTLTANPGPVVVQYVTLRPRIGFTVHLTAPTTMRASFNYIVLLGELF